MAEAPTSAAVPVDAQNTPITAGQLAAAIAAAETRVQAQCMAIVAQMIEEIDTGGGRSDSGGNGTSDVATALSPAPFTVRWDFDEECWKMDLPECSVTLDGEDITPEEPDLSEGTWYLNITYPKGGKSSSSDEAAKIEQEQDDKADLSIPIVELDEDQVVMQYLTGALHLTRGGGTGIQLFEPEYDDEGELTGEVLRPYIMAGRKVLEASGGIGDGTWGVRVTHSDENLEAEIVSIDGPVQDNSDPQSTTIPLYTIEDGEITEDFRGMTTVPLYDPV